jgi:hypothetical protein
MPLMGPLYGRQFFSVDETSRDHLRRMLCSLHRPTVFRKLSTVELTSAAWHNFICLKLSRTITIEQRTIATIKYKEREKSASFGNADLPTKSQGYWSTVTPMPRQTPNFERGDYPLR